jgi:hypothetical protein
MNPSRSGWKKSKWDKKLAPKRIKLNLVKVRKIKNIPGRTDKVRVVVLKAVKIEEGSRPAQFWFSSVHICKQQGDKGSGRGVDLLYGAGPPKLDR